MSGDTGTDVKAFSKSVQRHLHAGGYTQQQLAKAMNLHPKVLSRKLNGTGSATLDKKEIRRIILMLAEWQAISSQKDVYQLLEQAHLEPAFFQEDDWRSPPLSTLEKKPGAESSRDRAAHSPPLLHNLPAPTTQLIGRMWAIDHIRQLLMREDVRLVTLTGAGGSGKTRLALHVAQLLLAYPHGVWFVSLAAVNDPAFVPLSIVQALNIGSTPDLTPLQSLIEHLRNKQLLLVLDNFEQVSDAATAVHQMLTATPRLKILVTSRSPLRLSYEHQFIVPPLDTPDPKVRLKASRLLQFESVQLFVERAQAVAPDFAMTDENAPAIACICAKLDGLPLALELAAARMKILPPAQLLERLDIARLPLLAGGAKDLPDRQQTLLNTLIWSYNLLSPAEQVWFSRLGAFQGSWSLEAVEAMEQDLPQEFPATGVLSIDMLAQLVDISLVIRLPARARYTMLETIREYAQRQLMAHGELERLRDWHTCYYMHKAEGAEIGLRGPQQQTWLARLDAERDNLRTALEWALHKASAGLCIQFFASSASRVDEETTSNWSHSRKLSQTRDVSALEVALRLAAALRPSWEWQGLLAEARYWLNAALAIPPAPDAAESERVARAKALSEAARLACLQNDQERAVQLAEESIALWQELEDPAGLAIALLHRGWAAHATGEYEKAIEVYQEGLEQLSGKDDAWVRAELLAHLAAATGFTSDFERMQLLYAHSLELFEKLGDVCAIADVLKDWGGLLIVKGEYREAINRLLQSLHLCYELNNKQFIASGLGSLHFAFGLQEKPDAEQASLYSAKLIGAAEALMDAIGFTPWTRSDRMAQMVRAAIRSRVDEQAWEAAYAEGRMLSFEQAIELANQLGKNTQCN